MSKILAINSPHKDFKEEKKPRSLLSLKNIKCPYCNNEHFSINLVSCICTCNKCGQAFLVKEGGER